MKTFFEKHTRAVRVIQHFLAALIAACLIIVFAGTGIMISGATGDYSYNLYESDRKRSYEESYLFNNILGNNLSDIIRLIAIRTQLETKGKYDGEKYIDVTAYVNRNTNLTGDYITAVYTLSDLIKWAEGGFSYETRRFSKEQSEEFLSSSTTYTHLKSNQVSGGMNSYLNSQLENNSINFAVSGNSSQDGGDHSVLLTRYQTITGKNIENLVSTWDEYSMLCSYVEEAAKDLDTNYRQYGDLLEYFNQDNSNLRYYLSRTVNGKTERYTNIDSLSAETTGVDIKAVFESYGKYLYYCPYELSFETNTLIKESVLRKLLKAHSYAFPDQIKLYVAVDTLNYGANDAFVQGKAGFSKYIPYESQLLILAVVTGILYLLLLVLTVKYIPAEIADQHPGHRLFTEGIVFMGIAVMAIPVAVFVAGSFISGLSISKIVKLSYFPLLAAAMAFIADIGLLFAVYSLSARGKGKLLYKESFLSFLASGIRNAIVNTTDNGNVIIRTWIPYLTFVVINILLVKLGIAGVFIAAILDLLVGIYLYRQNLDRDKIINVIENIQNGDVKAKVDAQQLHGDNIKLADAVNTIGEGIDRAVNISMKDEKLKADLITNVSHDIKTPLTSIINYVDLIKRENIENERVNEYLDVLDSKANKLKQLTEDLVEVSKITSGNINISLSQINFVELVNQTIGEFYEKFENKNLQPIFKPEEANMQILADPRHLWRVLENLVNNVCKYALGSTRVYMDMYYENGDEEGKRKVVFSIKNISESELNLEAGELTERFIRGDESRTTEGSGLGLSIAKSLTQAQGGDFNIRLDGDLFKVLISFDAI